MENNTYLERYRKQSIILDGNRNGSDLNQPLILGDVNNLKSHLRQLLGGGEASENPGFYWAPDKRLMVPGKIKRLKEELTGLEQQFDKYAQSRLLIGEPRPQVWPDDLQEKKLKTEARLQIAFEEQKELERLLAQALEQQAKSRPSLLTHPKYWGSGQLKDGVLVEIGPWNVKPDSEGLLRISDTDSPYDTMPVWRFKSEILKPMGNEFAHRHKQEETEAVKLTRPRRKVNYPIPGRWSKESDLIEYEGYSNVVIKKLKQEI